jgi:voltage-gated potassium channel
MREAKNVKAERSRLLHSIESFLEAPMIVLGFIWMALLIVELVQGSSPWVERTGTVIWIIFIADFVIKFSLAPEKAGFIKGNILTLISLVIPAVRVLRVFRLLRVVRLTRGLRLVKVLGTLNRSIRALAATMKRRAFGYVVLLSLIVIFAGAAGMYAFEKDVPGGLDDYGTAVWWTTMIMTTLGSEYWPQTVEGRILCLIIALFAFAVFGYITATIATFFIGRDAESNESEIAGSKQIHELKEEVSALRQTILELKEKLQQL